MTSYLRGMYKLQPIDYLKLNKNKLAEIYNCSDIDALNYMLDFCDDSNRAICKRLIQLNNETKLGCGDKDFTESEFYEYIDGKRKLLEHFDVMLCFGDAIVKETVMN